MTPATKLEGPIVINPAVHGDERGFFCETWRQSQMDELGIAHGWVQDNHSRSARGVVRGLHYQDLTAPMAKLVRCTLGAIFDVAVDLRVGSPTFGRWVGVRLSGENFRQLYIPAGFAHGFCVLSDTADVIYKVSTYYDPASESGFRFDDPEVGIEWPDVELIPSERDATAPLLSEIADELPFEYEG